MRVLAHVCYGPCSLTVLDWLIHAGHTPTAFFFNPNIQPLAEYGKRRESALLAAQHYNVPFLAADTLPYAEQAWSSDTPPEQSQTQEKAQQAPNHDVLLDTLPPSVNPVYWLRYVEGHEYERCPLCWSLRLTKTAQLAQKKGFEGITTTLLYSRYQDHATLKEQGETIAARYGLSFVYYDFREFWQRGIDASKALGLYRQQYCGCIYSEYNRYTKPFLKSLRG